MQFWLLNGNIGLELYDFFSYIYLRRVGYVFVSVCPGLRNKYWPYFQETLWKGVAWAKKEAL